MSNISLKHLYTHLESSITAIAEDSGKARRSREIVEIALEENRPVYGVNTGLGILAQERIEPHQLKQLQRNLVLSHAVGVGKPVPKDISRIILGLKIHSLGLGFSGVSLGTLDRLIALWQRDLIPVMPSRGSVGASGDLAPLAHLALPLLGEGAVWDSAGEATIPAGQALEASALEPIELQPKDGLALVNGTQFMSAYGAYVLERAAKLTTMADVISVMSLEALQGSVKPFDARIHEARPHPGQIAVAENVRTLLASSEILESHRDCGKVQDPYSLRCVPQVHGASRDALDHASAVVDREINSATDNPLVFDDGTIISGGNFHGQPLALALDYTAIALAELANISERRTYLLLEGHDGLPRLLMRETGINSGFMVPQYTAAALVSENKILCHPASVDSIPTSLGQEDHVSMGSISAVKLLDVYRNVETVLSIELFTAAQALDYRKPLRPGRGVELAHDFVRSVLPHTEVDHRFGDDLALCRKLLAEASLLEAVRGELGNLN